MVELVLGKGKGVLGGDMEGWLCVALRTLVTAHAPAARHSVS